MEYKCSILLLLIVAVYGASAERARFDNYRVYEVSVRNNVQLQVLKYLEQFPDGYYFWESPVQVDMEVRIVIPPHKFADFEELTSRLNMEKSLKINNLQKLIDNEQIKRRRSNEFDWKDYNTLDEMYDWFDDLVKQYGNILTIESYGHSYEGREMKAVKLSKGSGNPGIFLESNIHAREWITSATVTWILNQLLTSTDPAVQNLADSYDWYILPVVNPDGLNYTKEVNRMWRKNRYPHNLLCYGVDMNRNFPGHWMEGGASSNPCSDTFAGPEPASEVETQNIINYFLKYKTNIDFFLSFHSYGQYLLLPFGYANADKSDHYYDWMDMAEAAAVALSRRYGTLYQFGTTSDVLYIASGSSPDWAHGEHGVPVAVTYEFRDKGSNGFILPAEQIIPNAEEVLDSLIAFIGKGKDLGYFKTGDNVV
ncbi:zinc carboxypeptidase-like [Toxorhynchites rutilus septentrionalis]|uniref:zinc carboxypeptidase-like n=1 Tax=Toxorhynchites rutilus septentrionalis TaxID=329112 RepID=UPI00247A53FB|nr:zinc carboxypeptidase-like [Toxorhynchites rutilus septentrionalis]